MTRIQEVRTAVRDKYAWPGGYPLHLFLADGGTLCIDCARREWRRVAWATRHPGEDKQWEVIQTLRPNRCSSLPSLQLWKLFGILREDTVDKFVVMHMVFS